ncbi:DUF4142 domain-containing protein [Planctomicrobium sp. SH664]|uniref:DUF4142 domain-containing protein n=1 Tax=Planctomicrobium sp. SH664 TaxID=3448125 RepID=UPI003F5C44B4
MNVKYLAIATALLGAQTGLAQNIKVKPEAPREIRQEQREIRQEQREERQVQRDLNRNQRNANELVENPVQVDRRTGAVQGASLDQRVVDCLLLGNQEEVELCKFALQHAQDNRVKELAQQMINDHEGFIQRLQKFSGQTGTLQPLDHTTAAIQVDREGVRIQSKETRNDNNARVTVKAGYAPQQDEMYQLERDAVRNCLNLTKEALQKEQGAKFDKAFLGQQCGAHIGMQAKLAAAENHVSPELKQIVHDGLQSTMKHRDHIDQLMNDLHQEKAKSQR